MDVISDNLLKLLPKSANPDGDTAVSLPATYEQYYMERMGIPAYKSKTTIGHVVKWPLVGDTEFQTFPKGRKFRRLQTIVVGMVCNVFALVWFSVGRPTTWCATAGRA